MNLPIHQKAEMTFYYIWEICIHMLNEYAFKTILFLFFIFIIEYEWLMKNLQALICFNAC